MANREKRQLFGEKVTEAFEFKEKVKCATKTSHCALLHYKIGAIGFTSFVLIDVLSGKE